MRKYQREKLGNVYAIPLPDGKFGFGRLFNEGALAVYRHIGQSIDDTPKEEDYQFTVGVFKKVLTCGEWSIVENRPFTSEEEAWQPPKYIWHYFTGKYKMYYKGQILPSTKAECQGLEEASVWEGGLIIDRIMGGDIWTKTIAENQFIKEHGQAAFDELTKDS